MQLTIGRAELARAISSVAKAIEARNTIPILGHVLIDATGGDLRLVGTDLDIEATATAHADISSPGAVCVDAKLIGDIANKAGNADINISLDDGVMVIKSGRSRFSLQTQPAEDFPHLRVDDFEATFDVDIASLFAPVQFAISNEEARFFLNGIYFIGGNGVLTAVATDGHRLAKKTTESDAVFEGIIVPKKLCGMLPKGASQVSVNSRSIQIKNGDLVLVSKLIDGSYPDYERVIPRQNDKVVILKRDDLARASERVVTVSSIKGRGVKLSIAPGSVSLSARSDIGTAVDEIEAEYSGEPIDVGFNSQYVRDMFAVMPSGDVKMELQENGPARITGNDPDWEGVLMPMRV